MSRWWDATEGRYLTEEEEQQLNADAETTATGQAGQQASPDSEDHKYTAGVNDRPGA